MIKSFFNLKFAQRIWVFFTLIGLLALGTDFSTTYRLSSAPLSVEVNYIDVTEGGLFGDSILIRSSEGKVALIDGGFPHSGAAQYLRAQKVKYIDLMVLSHPHDDHAGGLTDVLQKIPVDKLVINGQSLVSPTYAAFADEVKETGLNPIVARAGDTLKFGRLKFEVLSPPFINPLVWNDNSLVLRLVVGKVAFLFTGDIGSLQEAWLLANSQFPLKADILKVGHHGADTSSSPAFIVQVDPAVAIYTAGTGNRYNFPSPVTLKTLESVGAKIYGTDLNGTITVTTDGETYSVKTDRGGPRNP